MSAAITKRPYDVATLLAESAAYHAKRGRADVADFMWRVLWFSEHCPSCGAPCPPKGRWRRLQCTCGATARVDKNGELKITGGGV